MDRPSELPALNPPSEAPPQTDGTLGATDDLYYRRVWQYDHGWSVVVQGYVRSFGPNCTFEGPTFCSMGPPYIYEVWWKWSPSTIGTGGEWIFAAERQNW